VYKLSFYFDLNIYRYYLINSEITLLKVYKYMGSKDLSYSKSTLIYRYSFLQSRKPAKILKLSKILL
jgi:hypothetical protein